MILWHDIIVGYSVSTSETFITYACSLKDLDKSTLYDPILALDGGSDGLFFYKEIINYLYEIEYKGEVYFEIDPLIISDFLKFLLEKNVKISYKKDDYLKLDRLLKISFPFNY